MLALTRIDLDETLRCMGCPPERASEQDRALARKGADRLLPVIRPRWAYRVFPLSFEEGGVRLDRALLLPGKALKAHLSGCERAAVFCATLGAGADALLRRLEREDMALALAADCAASAAVEQVCDRIELELQKREFPGCFFPFRFSPGYGDLPLDVQNELLDLLDAPRRVGLTATDAHILTPRKSVTAVLGVSEHEIQRKSRSCLGCPARENCQYRKSGGHCGVS